MWAGRLQEQSTEWKGTGDALEYGIELDDVEGHRVSGWEDMTGQEVTVRMDDGTEPPRGFIETRFLESRSR